MGAESGKDIRISKTCRGMGKIYALVELVKEVGHAELRATSTLPDGTQLPCSLVPLDEHGRWVLVLAIVRVSQDVSIELLDSDGEVLARHREAFPAHLAQLKSKLHTVLGDELVARIRNIDAKPRMNAYHVEVDRVIVAQNGTTIIQGTARCVSSRRDDLLGEIETKLLGQDGHDVGSDSCVSLRDIISEHPDYAGCWVRSIQFSFRMSSKVASAIVWMYDASGTCQDGFRSLLARELSEMRKDWSAITCNAFSDDRYEEWYCTKHRAGADELAMQRREYELRGGGPTFSVVVPLYRTPVAFFDEMASSVLGQSYGRFELVLVNASPDDAKLAAAVSNLAAADDRVRVVELEDNLGIAENTNAGIAVATGDFVCFLDHDDTLALDALFCYAKAIDERPDTDMLYSDEDHIERGVYKEPYFKPDWEPDLLLGMNYVCHFLAVRKSIVDSLEPATSIFDGSQDHYMALRVGEVARHVHHVRRVLYHWRVHPGSTANNTDAKPYAVEAGRLAVQAHLDRVGAHARAVHSTRAKGRYEVEYELESHPLVSIVIPNKDSVLVLDRCLRSIRERTDYDNYEVVIVENNSTDDATFSYYERAQSEDSRVRVVRYERSGPFNYSAINNFGVAQSRGELLLLLNNDTEAIEGGWLTRMVSLCMRDSTGAVGAKLLYPDETIQHVGVLALMDGPSHVNMYRDAHDGGYVENALLMQDMSAVTGACLMTRRSVFDELGGLDEELAVDYNDVDYCWKVRKAGLLVVMDPSVMLYHYESVSRGFYQSDESKLRFVREKGILRKRWPRYYAFADPAGNPNLDQHSGYSKLG